MAAMALFIIFIVSMGVKMVSSNQALYEDDYYEQGENHAERMEQEQFGESVSASFNQSTSTVEVKFDSIGHVRLAKFVHLANSKFDRNINVTSNLDKDYSEIVLMDLEPGAWVMELNGVVNGEKYFKKQQFVK
jgi:hypothetical protein